MAQLEMAGSAWGVTVSIEVSTIWDRLSREQRRLFELARQFDRIEDRLVARDRRLAADYVSLTDDRKIFDRNVQDLMANYRPLKDERDWLSRERSRLDSAKAAIESARANGGDPPTQGYINDAAVYDARLLSYLPQERAFESQRMRLDGDAAAWNTRAQSLEAARLSLEEDGRQFERDQSANYDGALSVWEAEVDRFIDRQRQERDRIRTEIAAKSSSSVPPLEPPMPKIDAAALPRMMVDALTAPQRLLRSSSVYAATHPDEVGEAVLTLAPIGIAAAGIELSAPAAAIIWGGKLFYDAGIKGGHAREIQRQKEELDQRRRIPAVTRQLDALNRSLEDRVRDGTISAEEKRRRLGERANYLVGGRPNLPNAEMRLIEDLFMSSEWTWGVVTAAGGWGIGDAAKKAAKPVIQEAMALVNASSREVAVTGSLFKLGVKKGFENSVKSVRPGPAGDGTLRPLGQQ